MSDSGFFVSVVKADNMEVMTNAKFSDDVSESPTRVPCSDRLGRFAKLSVIFFLLSFVLGFSYMLSGLLVVPFAPQLIAIWVVPLPVAVIVTIIALCRFKRMSPIARRLTVSSVAGLGAGIVISVLCVIKWFMPPVLYVT